MLRLLIVSTWWPCPPDNGSRLRAYHLIRQLSRRYRITLIAFGRNSAGLEERPPLEAICDEVHVVAPAGRRDGTFGVRGLLSRVPRHFVQSESPAMRALVSSACSCHDLALALEIEAATYLADHEQLPRVFDEVEVSVPRDRVTTAATLRARVRHGLTWFKHRHFVRALIERFDAATVVSVAERRAVEAIGIHPDRLRLVPNGVHVGARREPARRIERLIYPGSIGYFANLDAVGHFVRNIFPLVRRARPDVEFWVTGDTAGRDLSSLQAPGVTFTGYVADIERLIEESSACVVPLRIGGGTRLKVLQAMALETPVVSSSKGIEGLDVTPEEHVIVGDTAEVFAQQVVRVLENRATAERVARRARALVEAQYSWRAVADTLEGVLDETHARFHAGRHSVPTVMMGAPAGMLTRRP